MIAWEETSHERPLRVMFCTTSMPVGGAETLLVNLVRRLDPARLQPEICCLKERGPLGDMLAEEIPVHAGFTSHRLDVRVLWRLKNLFKTRQIDAVVTVGAGDKMFWGRLAAAWAGVPVVCSALHSTGWPDGVGRLNRCLTPLTDAFIAVADPHGEYLVTRERFPQSKVVVIPNGIDTDRFRPGGDDLPLRRELGIGPAAPVVGIVAALRPEKNHRLFLDMAARVLQEVPETQFAIVGDGPCRGELQTHAQQLGITSSVRFLGTRQDVPELLGMLQVLVLSSDNEANPVSILEALSTATPVVATDVGSVRETVVDGKTGFLVPAGDAARLAERVVELVLNPLVARSMGDAGRKLVLKNGSLEGMVGGYEQLLTRLYAQKAGGGDPCVRTCREKLPLPEPCSGVGRG